MHAARRGDVGGKRTLGAPESPPPAESSWRGHPLNLAWRSCPPREGGGAPTNAPRRLHPGHSCILTPPVLSRVRGTQLRSPSPPSRGFWTPPPRPSDARGSLLLPLCVIEVRFLPEIPDGGLSPPPSGFRWPLPTSRDRLVPSRHRRVSWYPAAFAISTRIISLAGSSLVLRGARDDGSPRRTPPGPARGGSPAPRRNRRHEASGRVVVGRRVDPPALPVHVGGAGCRPRLRTKTPTPPPRGIERRVGRERGYPRHFYVSLSVFVC